MKRMRGDGVREVPWEIVLRIMELACSTVERDGRRFHDLQERLRNRLVSRHFAADFRWMSHLADPRPDVMADRVVEWSIRHVGSGSGSRSREEFATLHYHIYKRCRTGSAQEVRGTAASMYTGLRTSWAARCCHVDPAMRADLVRWLTRIFAGMEMFFRICKRPPPGVCVADLMSTART